MKFYLYNKNKFSSYTITVFPVTEPRQGVTKETSENKYSPHSINLAMWVDHHIKFVGSYYNKKIQLVFMHFIQICIITFIK